MAEREEAHGVQFGRPDQDGGLFFGYLVVVEELYREFIDLHTVPNPLQGLHIHARGLRSRTSEAIEMLRGPDAPVVVEATLVSAADILASGYAHYRILGATYLITADSEKCSLYYRPDKTHDVLLHTGATSIVTIMAQAYAKHLRWQNSFTDLGTGLDLGDYTTIREYARDVIASGKAHPICFAFVLSGVENTVFQEMQSHDFRCVDDLAGHFFKIITSHSGGRFASLMKGVPGTVLLTRASDLQAHGGLLQAFVDAWCNYVQNVLPSRDNWQRLRASGFMPLAWTEPVHLCQATMFTEYVLEEFGATKLKRMKPLYVSDYVPLLPQSLSGDQKAEVHRALIRAYLAEAANQYGGVMPANMGDALPPLLAQYKTEAVKHYEALEVLAKGSDASPDAKAAEAADHARQLRTALEMIRPEQPPEETQDWRVGFDPKTGECWYRKDSGEVVGHTLEPAPQSVFTVMIWRAMLAMEGDDPGSADVWYEWLFAETHGGAFCGALLSNLRAPQEDQGYKYEEWMKHKIAEIRQAIGDKVTSRRQKQFRWIGCKRSTDSTTAKYYLRIAESRELLAEFKCPIVDAFSDLCAARDANEGGNADEALGYIGKARKRQVDVPPGLLAEFGLTDLWEERAS
jgi:hypothetical protein